MTAVLAAFSQLELPGSPVEQGSSAVLTYYWDPRPELTAGATVSAPAARVYAYPLGTPAVDVADMSNVTGTVLGVGSPFLAGAPYVGMMGVTLQSLAAGQCYRVVLSCTGSDGNTVERYFTVRCYL